MQCGTCRGANDADAKYCVNCGSALDGSSGSVPERPARTWWYLLLLVPVLAFAAGIGYYKFYLPQGVAAVVNGEEISSADVDRAVSEITGGTNLPEDARARLRYAVLSRMITERIVWQEARREGITISQDEMNAAVERRRMSAGMDEKTFEERVKARYGSMAAFRRTVEQQLAFNKFVDEKVTAGAADAATVSARLEQWLRDIRGRAVVRIALAEDLPAGGECGCGGRPGAAAQGRACSMQRGQIGNMPQASQASEARKAALAYWRERYGGSPVDTRVQDFGCHIEVDIVKDNRIAKSLRYQNGTITEM